MTLTGLKVRTISSSGRISPKKKEAHRVATKQRWQQAEMLRAKLASHHWGLGKARACLGARSLRFIERGILGSDTLHKEDPRTDEF